MRQLYQDGRHGKSDRKADESVYFLVVIQSSNPVHTKLTNEDFQVHSLSAFLTKFPGQ